MPKRQWEAIVQRKAHTAVKLDINFVFSVTQSGCDFDKETVKTAGAKIELRFKNLYYNKCVQREAVPRTAKTHYYRLPMWPEMCVTQNVMVQQMLWWFGAYPEKQ